MANVEKMIAETFLEMAQGLESGSYGKRPKIALTGMGSEHGEENAMEAALMAAKDGVDVYYIGSLEAEGVTTVKVADDEEGHKKMEEMLANGEVDGAVTMHFPFPIGVSTVGRVVTPAKGREMFVANTTGTSSADRIEGMIKNTIYGIIAAKTCGIANPTVGILNVDGARQTEKALKELQENGYDITFAESARADGGCVMRGNDVLQGTPDIMVTDSLTGNIMVKMRDASPVIILQYMGVLKAILNELCCTGEDIVTIPAHILFKKVIIDQYRSFDMHPLQLFPYAPDHICFIIFLYRSAFMGICPVCVCIIIQSCKPPRYRPFILHTVHRPFQHYSFLFQGSYYCRGSSIRHTPGILCI